MSLEFAVATLALVCLIWLVRYALSPVDEPPVARAIVVDDDDATSGRRGR